MTTFMGVLPWQYEQQSILWRDAVGHEGKNKSKHFYLFRCC